MKKYITSALVLMMLIGASCGLSAEQAEVKDAYNSLIDEFDAGNYGNAFDMMSLNTQQFLNELAAGLEAWGYPMGGDGREFLEEMFTGQDMTGMTRSISSVTVSGNRATLIAQAEDGDELLEFALEDGEWRIDLETQISDGFSEGLEGSGLTIEEILEGEPEVTYDYPSSGDGICPIDFYNELEDYTIFYVYVDLSTDPWGEDRLGAYLLEPGDLFTVWVDPGTYDLRVEDEDGDTYTLWDVEVDEDGVYWYVTLADMD